MELEFGLLDTFLKVTTKQIDLQRELNELKAQHLKKDSQPAALAEQIAVRTRDTLED